MVNSLIKHGMVVYVGKDPRGGYIVYRYDTSRDKSSRCVCFADSIGTFTKLGFKTAIHWNEDRAAQGWMSVTEIDPQFRKDISDLPYMDPVVAQLLDQKVSNQDFAHLLSREG